VPPSASSWSLSQEESRFTRSWCEEKTGPSTCEESVATSGSFALRALGFRRGLAKWEWAGAGSRGWPLVHPSRDSLLFPSPPPSAAAPTQIEWHYTGSERFGVDNPQVALVFTPGELTLVEYGASEVLANIRTEYTSPHLFSIRIGDSGAATAVASATPTSLYCAGRAQPGTGWGREGERGREGGE